MTAEEIAHAAKSLLVHDRARLMQLISHGSTRTGTISSVRFFMRREIDDVIEIALTGGERVFVSPSGLSGLVNSFSGRFVDEIGEDAASRLLAGKHVLIDEFPTADGVSVRVRRDRDRERGDAATRTA